ncbi:MAG: glucose-6-phosphate isomerase [Candidatus Marinimicrobia bacterium]|nr:glucose-6-phosphate isomerase [Candidatus Neomarinimicrobiota bacterium]
MIEYSETMIRERYPRDYSAVRKEAESALKILVARNGRGSDLLGWLDLPDTSREALNSLLDTAKAIRDSGDLLVCIGIGGSYLGARAFIHALFGDRHRVRFIGHHLSPLAWSALLEELETRDFYLNVISKSGTTTEPGIAFRILREFAEKKYGKTTNERIIATTDAESGALCDLAKKKGYRRFIIPRDVGGRFSVLTPVGLLPIFAAGADPDQLIRGASAGFKASLSLNERNPALNYAAGRTCCYRKGKAIEVLASFEPRMHYFSEWWKQLYGESEGKNGKGIFPASVDFTTDLHSMGQWIQDGVRNLFETFVMIDHYQRDINIPKDQGNLDNLNYLAGQPLGYVNRKAFEGTRKAHEDGGVPTSVFHLDYLDEEHLAKLTVIFEVAVALSAYMLGVNPFDQPGVEAYKQNMFALLGKPGK